jgi:hypothetical protein
MHRRGRSVTTGPRLVTSLLPVKLALAPAAQLGYEHDQGDDHDSYRGTPDD